jgi:hypothetical protein
MSTELNPAQRATCSPWRRQHFEWRGRTIVDENANGLGHSFGAEPEIHEAPVDFTPPG